MAEEVLPAPSGYELHAEWYAGSTAMPKLRVTPLYRRDADGWKIVHRHADPLVHQTVPT